jgi:hypothetical protein
VIRKKIPLRHEVQVAVFVGTTPFNGENAAGPMGMFSGVDVTTALGPLCLGSEDQHGTGYQPSDQYFERLSCFAGFILRSISGADGEALNL